MTNIAHMYYQGTGLKRDINRAMQYYIMAAEKDHPRAQYLLGEAYETGHGLEKDCSRALYWYKKAAEQVYTFFHAPAQEENEDSSK